VIQRLLLLASTLCTAVVVFSFVLFAVEEANAGSTTQQNKIDNVDQASPSAHAERACELVDDANDQLTSPFDGIAGSTSNIWVQRGVPALLAVLLYFVLLRVLAGYAVKLRV
jgi:hypothetical protein